MIPRLGQALVLLALLASSTGSVLGFATGLRPTEGGVKWTRRLAYAFSAFITLANLLMVVALLTHDFSVSYVQKVGSRLVPTWVSLVSLWSSLEGSILFWGLVLGIYVFGATWTNRSRYPEYMPWAIGVWLACGAFFCFLLAAPAEPFLAQGPIPPDGPGPNPLLQNHLLMAIHPPFLYSGYVGMTIPFGLACAALFAGRLGSDFIQPLRTWLLLPWIFLSCAIVLGGWWAYEVLGWGGYWAWDPVENASLLPWLTATAALHSALLMERKGILKGWTVTLVLGSFLLTILGTFMTRSGVFNSVHSFTQSPIGPTILAFLAAALLLSVTLLATRIDLLQSEGRLEASPSRDALFLVNNLVFVLLTFTVLLGTVFPLVVEAFRGLKMSVGRPYFDAMAVPLGVTLLFLLGVGPALPWGRATKDQLVKALVPPLAGLVVATALGLLAGARNPWTITAIGFGGYAVWVTIAEIALPVRQRMKGQGESVSQAFVEANLLRGRRRFAGYVVHAGAILVLVAIAVSSTMGVSKEFELRTGSTVSIKGYNLTFVRPEVRNEPNRQSLVAIMAVTRGGKDLGTLEPRMNQYDRQREPVGTPDVRSTIFEDLYLSILNIDPEGGTLSLKAIVNPMVGWIWGATGLMALGGLMAIVPKRRSEGIPLEAKRPEAGLAAARQ